MIFLESSLQARFLSNAFSAALAVLNRSLHTIRPTSCHTCTMKHWEHNSELVK